jgi:hypothetical protein
MIAIYLMLLTFHRARLGYLREHPDEGSVTLEKVVITAVLVAGAIIVGGILVTKAGDSANNIDTP